MGTKSLSVFLASLKHKVPAEEDQHGENAFLKNAEGSQKKTHSPFRPLAPSNPADHTVLMGYEHNPAALSLHPVLSGPARYTARRPHHSELYTRD